MDFLSIMEAAQDNKVKAQHNPGAVLKTKLTAPKKEQKKVDTAAIKKRLEDERKQQEAAKRKAEEKNKPRPKQPMGASTDKSKLKNSTTLKAKSAESSKPKEKPKYENKDHEQKHKQFMSKIEKIGKASEKRSDSPATGSSSKKIEDKKKHKVVVKPKKPPSVAAPSFQDLMKMAEKVAADPTSVPSPKPPSQPKTESKLKTEPGNKDRNGTQYNGSSKKSSKNADREQPKNHKQSSSDRHKDNQSKKSKHSGQETASKSSQSNKASSKSEQSNKQTPSVNKPNSSNKNVAGNKRPADRNSASGPPPNKMPALSEAARAKLAFKSGKRPLPPPSRPGTSSPAPRQDSNDLKQPAIANKKKILSLGGPAKSNDKPEPKDSKPTKVYDNSGGVSAWDRLMVGSNKPKENKAKKKQSRYIDSDEEDDDLDDFIDDGEDDIDYSAAIRDIFGYDKSRYRDEDFDDRSMVAGFADIMKEEVRSARLGREEDLRDMEMEEMEKKRKMMRKKGKK